jgi:glyoxylase-like metal-dependent hydrolase (beta-lactamase superfamily II)
MLTNGSSTISRRNALRLGLAAGVGALAPATAFAKAPFLNTQAPTFYRFKFGNGEATIVSDGVLPLGDPHKAFLAIPPAELDSMLSANFLSLTNAPLEQNTLVVNFGDRIVIFDNGMGNSKLFGDTTGKLLVTLAQAGIKPEDVDALVMTHAHIDHCGGIMSADGKPNFPNAQYFISESDFQYWTDPAKVGPNLKAFLEQATKNLVPVKDRITWVKDGQEIMPGVHAIAAPGHTVGHTIYMIQSGNDKLCYIGDVSHHPVLLLEKPLIEFAFDTDPKQAAKSRVRVLDMLAGDKTLTMAYHFPWPGIGHVVKQGEGFHWIPAPITTLAVGGI